ncbi:hypothetical protein V1504DRAFT_63906 [Lipomyces starkeyi]
MIERRERVLGEDVRHWERLLIFFYYVMFVKLDVPFPRSDGDASSHSMLVYIFLSLVCMHITSSILRKHCIHGMFAYTFFVGINSSLFDIYSSSGYDEYCLTCSLELSCYEIKECLL